MNYKRFWKAYAAIAIGLVAWLVYEILRPPLLIVGDVTVDIVEGKKVPGGAVSYSAAVAEGYGIRAKIVTAGGEEADLSVFDAHDLYLVETEETLTFEHTYTWWGQHRKLRVLEEPNITLSKDMVPWYWRCAQTVILGPLTPNDVDAASFTNYNWLERALCWNQRIGLMAQGFQRELDNGGKVTPVSQPSQQLLSGLAHNVSVFLSDVETDGWNDSTINEVASYCEQLLITRGADGASLYKKDSQQHIDVVAVNTVDTNGAGDTFATAYMISMMRNTQDHGLEASLAASQTVVLPQGCKPKCVSEGIRQMFKNQSTTPAFNSWLGNTLDFIRYFPFTIKTIFNDKSSYIKIESSNQFEYPQED